MTLHQVRIKSIGWALRLLAILVLFPCLLQAEESAKADEKTVTRVAVIPFQAVLPEEASSTVQCPICGSVNSSGPLSRGAEKIVEEMATDQLREYKAVVMVPPERVAGVYRRVSTNLLKQSLLQVFLETGRELNADALMAGFVYRYRERVGYDYSVERPAAVAFEIHLISVRDGRTIWRGTFDKTQKSLMEDVFQASSFFRGGAKWLTARQLTKLGVDNIFKTFPGFEP
ncbi:MAG TPA: hypothetical protein P5238_09295 [Smithellaceae bacterium]|nr:hypothetical protein [Smithellaceae bacterium]HRS83670.1 hypothetical protein [Smithellaceae bacterium]HRV45407.1 hypothetical protein [Smithellaceae bacterium]